MLDVKDPYFAEERFAWVPVLIRNRTVPVAAFLPYWVWLRKYTRVWYVKEENGIKTKRTFDTFLGWGRPTDNVEKIRIK